MELNDRLAVLDPARDREPSAEEWISSRAMIERIMTDTPEPTPARSLRRRRFALVGAVAAVAAVGAVAVPALLPSTADKAFASWTAAPDELSGGQVLPLAKKCADGSATTAADVLLAERRGVATLLILRQGGGTAECLSLDSSRAGAWMTLTDASTPPPAAGTAVIQTMSSVGSGDSQYSNVVGTVSPEVTGVDVILDNGKKIETSVRSGWWAAWWPGPEGGEVDTLKVVVHTASGSAAYRPEQLFAQ